MGHALYRAAARLKWSEPELLGLEQLVHPGDAVLDVGAALGMYTVPLAHITGPSGRVDSFEPQHRGFRTVGLLRSLTGASKGRLVRQAMGPVAGTGQIAVPFVFALPIFGHGHIAEGVNEGDRRVTRSDTVIDTIDDWVEREGIDRVAFIKVDVEGFEPSVIEGGRSVIGRDLPSLLLEIEDRHLVRYGRDAAGFVADVLGSWPEYRMYTWSGTSWNEVDRVEPEVRNYLFATDAALAR